MSCFGREAAGKDVILVDMDGVLADFESPNNRIVFDYGLTPLQERPDFYYTDTYRDMPGLLDVIYRENRRPGFFFNFPIIEGALEGWQRILEAGFVPRICSSPLEDHPTVIAEKRAWLEEHFVPQFGSWVLQTAIFDRDKSGYDACAMIDDRPTLRNMSAAHWQQVVFDRSYNQAITTDLRLYGWVDPALEALLQRCQKLY